MTYGKLNDTQYLLRFEKGEELVAALKAFCTQFAIQNAEISAIGSVESPTLAHYNVATKKYSEKSFEGIFEVTSLLGTIGLVENVPLPHLHATLSDESMQAFGGHVVKATISATLEMAVTVFATQFAKKHSDEIGLNLYELPNK